MKNVNDAMVTGALLARDTRADLTAELARLRARLADVGSHWQGAGAVAFHRVMAAWDDEAARILTALGELADNLDGTDRDWTVTDEESASSLALLAARLS